MPDLFLLESKPHFAVFQGNIAAVGYLLFAIWLSLHASVAAHAIGVEFLLD